MLSEGRFFRSFRIADSTNDMIMVKWHLLNFTKAEFVRIFTEYLLNVPKCLLNTRHDNREVTLIHLTRAQTLRSDKCATGSIHANGSMTITVIPCLLFCRSGLCLALWAIHICSKLQATTILAGITIHRALRKIFLKIFCVSNDDKCYGENMNWTEKYKNSKLIQAMKNTVCPKAKVIRKPNFSESRNYPNIYRMFPTVDWTHDMIIVKWHLFIWHERKLCALTNAPPVQSTQTGQWLSTLLHANCSAAQVYFLHSGQFIFALSCRRRPFLQVLQSTER